MGTHGNAVPRPGTSALQRSGVIKSACFRPQVLMLVSVPSSKYSYVPSSSAEGIEQALLDCLTRHRLTAEFLREHWVGFGADSTSIMLGSKSGVAARLRGKFPQIIVWHRFNVF